LRKCVLHERAGLADVTPNLTALDRADRLAGNAIVGPDGAVRPWVRQDLANLIGRQLPSCAALQLAIAPVVPVRADE
jgi:hypothetical protein